VNSLEFGVWVRTRRELLGITQQDLARRVSMHQPHLSAIEAGTRTAGPSVQSRLVGALEATPSQLLPAATESLLHLFADDFTSVKIFGSPATGCDNTSSDVDILAEPKPGVKVGLLAKARLTRLAEAILTTRVDVVFDYGRQSTVFDAVRREAVALA
jgi:predicted nucleotidyltransferase